MTANPEREGIKVAKEEKVLLVIGHLYQSLLISFIQVSISIV